MLITSQLISLRTGWEMTDQQMRRLCVTGWLACIPWRTPAGYSLTQHDNPLAAKTPNQDCSRSGNGLTDREGRSHTLKECMFTGTQAHKHPLRLRLNLNITYWSAETHLASVPEVWSVRKPQKTLGWHSNKYTIYSPNMGTPEDYSVERTCKVYIEIECNDVNIW